MQTQSRMSETRMPSSLSSEDADEHRPVVLSTFSDIEPVVAAPFCGLAKSCWRSPDCFPPPAKPCSIAVVAPTVRKPEKRVSAKWDSFQAYRLAENFKLSRSQVAEARKTFERYDTDGLGTLDAAEFQKMVESIVSEQYPNPNDIPEDLFGCADESSDGQVDFEEFLQWISMQSFREDLLLPIEEQEIRQIARMCGVPVPEVESVKRKFDRFDVDRSGTIEFQEFTQLLQLLLRVPKDAEIPRNRALAFWNEIDADGSGVVEFEEFLPWYMRYFPIGGSLTATPLECFYSSVRGNSFSRGSVLGRESFSAPSSSPKKSSRKSPRKREHVGSGHMFHGNPN